MQGTDSHSSFSKTKLTGVMCLVLLAIEIINLITGRALNQLGLIPREATSLFHIFTAPFLHGSMSHFVSNIVPFAIFSFLILQDGIKRFVLVTLCILLLEGMLVWALGRTAIHVGLSGVLYGYFGYLVLAGFLSKHIKQIIISFIIIVFYGGMIFGVLPQDAFVSWESHLFGLIAGLLAAKLLVKPSS
ncbi:rhomboid family intramembrane serine protease [Aestuariibacter sp. AA17]|uniref:Rhomboid family intramembrane serine protease n=1 Tax=Fluctibacter corallii TaxID=2984329 RepID=A0ABT3ABT9_9ALTE|nr:rhomboid family intramembrane serine protease [Aestuariibacter sp. AA17]MCV2886070.1 rhomboid family intramembrane serine protease [Aestuariibacter sp. AA17]